MWRLRKIAYIAPSRLYRAMMVRADNDEFGCPIGDSFNEDNRRSALVLVIVFCQRSM